MTDESGRMLSARRRYHAARFLAAAGIVVAALMFGGGMLVMSMQIRDAQSGIADCTRPGGACYRRAQNNADRIARLQADLARLRATHAATCNRP